MLRLRFLTGRFSHGQFRSRVVADEEQANTQGERQGVSPPSLPHDRINDEFQITLSAVPDGVARCLRKVRAIHNASTASALSPVPGTEISWADWLQADSTAIRPLPALRR